MKVRPLLSLLVTVGVSQTIASKGESLSLRFAACITGRLVQERCRDRNLGHTASGKDDLGLQDVSSTENLMVDNLLELTQIQPRPRTSMDGFCRATSESRRPGSFYRVGMRQLKASRLQIQSSWKKEKKALASRSPSQPVGSAWPSPVRRQMTSELLIDLQSPGMKRSPHSRALKDAGHKNSYARKRLKKASRRISSCKYRRRPAPLLVIVAVLEALCSSRSSSSTFVTAISVAAAGALPAAVIPVAIVKIPQ